jgi:hypothetical protein
MKTIKMSLDINNEEIEVETTTSKRNVFFLVYVRFGKYDLFHGNC